MEKEPVSLAKVKSIAFVASKRLGDCLINMVVSHNLRRNGFRVTTFSNHLSDMSHYFPQEDIKPYPSPEQSREVLSQFDVLIYVGKDKVYYPSDQWRPKNVILDNYALYHRQISQVDLQLEVCRRIFGLSDVVRTNGFKASPNLQHRYHTHRVIIHPSASAWFREWHPQRFIELAKQLMIKGFEPVFVFTPQEKERFAWVIENGFQHVADPKINSLAEFIYESGWFIGSDSGIGHLASNLGIPTVTLFNRRSLQKRWTPGWAPAETLLPALPLLFKPLKKRYWQYFISAPRVLKSFLRLVKSHPDKQNTQGSRIKL